MRARPVISTSSFVAAALLFCMLLAPARASETLYKWIDEEGNTRYSDRLPAEQKKKRHQTLSPFGHVLDTTEEAISPDELARMREEQKRQQVEERRRAEEAARIQAIKDHHDNVLLMTFSNEEEIVEAKEERVAVIESVINLLRKNITNEQQKLGELEQRAQEKYIDRDKAVPGGLAQNIEYFQEKILGIQQQLALKLEERDRVKQQYVEDLLRYRELTQNPEHAEKLRKARPPSPSS